MLGSGPLDGGGMLPLWGTGSVGVRAMLFWCSIIIHSGLHSSHTSSHSSWGGRGDKTPAPTAHPRHRGGLFSRVPLTPNGRSSWFSVCFDVSRAWMEGRHQLIIFIRGYLCILTCWGSQFYLVASSQLSASLHSLSIWFYEK